MNRRSPPQVSGPKGSSMPYLLDGYVSHVATRSFSGVTPEESISNLHCFRHPGSFGLASRASHFPKHENPHSNHLRFTSKSSILDPDDKVKHKFSTHQPPAYGSLQRAGTSTEQIGYEAQTTPALRLPDQLRLGNLRR